MSKGKNVWTSPNKNGSKNDKWIVKEEGSNKPIAKTATKKQAEKIGKKTAKQNEAEHILQKKDGTIGEKNSYGNDPCPPKDKD